MRDLLLGLGLLVFIAVIAGLLFAAQDDPGVALQDFSTRFLGIFIEAAPFLLIGSVVAGFIEVYVSREDIIRLIPRNPILATATGTLLGFAFPVCECGVVPVTRRLFTKGLPMSAGVAFLLAAPVMNPIVLVSTYVAFADIAPEIVVARFVLTAVIAVTVGMVFAFAARPQEVLRPVSLMPVRGGDGPPAPIAAPPARIDNVIRALKISGDEFFDMGRFLVVGCLLAAALQTFVSQETLLSLGEGPFISVVLMQALAFMLSVCSTVDSFLALDFYGTFSGGSVLGFLVFGPMVDIKSTLMFMGVFKRKVVFYLILLPFLLSLFFGVWANLHMGF
jgi:hypothetical protein